jgi:hypothetical protein
LKVRVYFLRKTKDPETSELADHPFEGWMLNNMYDLAWEAEFKTLITPDLIAFKFNLEPTPFGIPFKSKIARSKLEPGDVVQIGSAHHLRLARGFRELRL